MHRLLLFISYALAARAANPLLTKRQSGTSGGEPGINACLDPENSAPNTVRQAQQSQLFHEETMLNEFKRNQRHVHPSTPWTHRATVVRSLGTIQ